MDDPTPERTPRQFSTTIVWITVTLSAAVGFAAGGMTWGTTNAEHRDAFDIAWKSAAAVLAILATFLTVERLRVSQNEHFRLLAADDAKAKIDKANQITDLSAKASEQLGSEKAAVRIGGLIDLERLAQTYPELRLTIVERICAYLRGPYQPPGTLGKAATVSVSTQQDDEPAPPLTAEQLEALRKEQEDEAARRLELDVRRTAQKILKRHLTWPKGQERAPEAYWTIDMLDLRDAVLVDFDLSECRVSAHFQRALFHGVSDFSSSSFTHVNLEEVIFSGSSRFDEALFQDRVSFLNATFAGSTSFLQARFLNEAEFNSTYFHGFTQFNGARFDAKSTFDLMTATSSISFESVNFGGYAQFSAATFVQQASFRSSCFRDVGEFFESRFISHTDFQGAKFDNHATLGGLIFNGDARFNDVAFARQCSFSNDIFGGDVSFVGASFVNEPNFSGSRVQVSSQRQFWPSGWRTGATTLPDRPRIVEKTTTVENHDSDS